MPLLILIPHIVNVKLVHFQIKKGDLIKEKYSAFGARGEGGGSSRVQSFILFEDKNTSEISSIYLSSSGIVVKESAILC